MTAFAAWLWQGLLLALVVELLVRAVPRMNAATRYLIWWGGLAGLIALGLVNLWSELAPAAIAAGAAVPTDAPTPPWLSLPAAPGWVMSLALGAWAVAALLGVVRVVRGMRGAAALRRGAIPLAADRASRLASWSTRQGKGRSAPALVTSAPIGACALGFRRPAILVSRRLLDTLDDAVLDQVLLHEQAHLDRYDDWLRVLQSLAAGVVVVHPATHLISRRIDLEREAACDDRVVAVTGAADRYAACLAEAAAVTATRVPIVAPSVLGGSTPGGSLRARVLRLLDPRTSRGHRIARPIAVAAGAAIVAVLLGAPVVPSLIVFVENAAPPAPARDRTAVLVARRPPAALTTGSDGVPAAAARALPPATSSTASSKRVPRRASIGPEEGAVAVVPTAAEATAAEPSRETDVAPSLPPAPEALGVAALDVPADALGGSSLALTEAPPDHGVAGTSPGAPAPVASEPSVFGNVSHFGRSSAATARKAGLTVAGTFVRAGKAIGKLF